MHSPLDDGQITPLRKITDPKEVVRINDLKLEINENSKKARWGRYCLFALPVLYLIAGYIQQTDDPEDYTLIGTGIYGAFFLVCAGLTYRWLTVGLTIGLGLYLIDHIVAAYMSPSTIFQGVFVKIGILFTLGTAIYASIQLRRHIEALAKYPVPRREIEQARKLQPIRRTRQPISPSKGER